MDKPDSDLKAVQAAMTEEPKYPQRQAVQFEPDCWRGKLKPDLYAVTLSGEYADHWFFEVDRSTEAPSRVVDKCRRYVTYCRSGAEQRRSGVFPLVVWIVPDGKRKVSIEQHIKAELGGFASLFQIKVCDELSGLWV